MRAVLDRFDEASNTFADLVFFGGHAFAIGEQSFVLTQIDRDIRAFKTPDRRLFYPALTPISS